MPLTHFDAEGKARMVDVTEKKETVREATATGKIKVSRDVYDAIEAGTVGKGDVLSVATTAGIMGVKRTADLIPMCHILPITNCKIRFDLVSGRYVIDAKSIMGIFSLDLSKPIDLNIHADSNLDDILAALDSYIIK